MIRLSITQVFIARFVAICVMGLIFFSAFSAPIISVRSQAVPTTPTKTTPTPSSASTGSKIKISDGAGSNSGFKDCSFDFKDASATDTATNSILQKCIQSVIRFVLVVGIFTMVFRVAFAAIMSVNGEGGDKASKAIKDAIYDVVIGILLIGAPGLIIYTVNPAALNLGALNLGNIANISNSNGVGGAGGGDTGSGSGVGSSKINTVTSTTNNDQFKIIYDTCAKDATTDGCKKSISSAVNLQDTYNKQCKNLGSIAGKNTIQKCKDIEDRLGAINQIADLKNRVVGGVDAEANQVLNDLLDECTDGLCELTRDYQLVRSVGSTFNPRSNLYYVHIEPFGGGKPGERVVLRFDGQGCSQNPIVRDYVSFQANPSAPKNKIASGTSIDSPNCKVTQSGGLSQS